MIATATVIPRVLNIGANISAPLANISTESVATTLINGALEAGGLASSFGSYTLAGIGTTSIIATSLLTGAAILLTLSACPEDSCPTGLRDVSGACVREIPVERTPNVLNVVNTRLIVTTTTRGGTFRSSNGFYNDPILTDQSESTSDKTINLITSAPNVAALDSYIGTIEYDQEVITTPTSFYYTDTPDFLRRRYYTGINRSQTARLAQGSPSVVSPSLEVYRWRALVGSPFIPPNATPFIPIECSSTTRVVHQFSIDNGDWVTLSDHKLDPFPLPTSLQSVPYPLPQRPPRPQETLIQVRVSVTLSLPTLKVGSVLATPGVSVSWVVGQFQNPFPDNDISSITHKVVGRVIKITSTRLGDVVLLSVPYAGPWLSNALDVAVTYRVVPR